MKKLSRQAYNEIRNWVYRNARPIELALWQYEFENGSKEAVLSALAFFQNEDGGFGHALEPDNWNPNSTPYTTLYAIGILEEIEFTDTKHPIMQGIVRFLESGKHLEEYGWDFNIQSNDNYPHAPWWSYSKEENVYESIGVTLGLCCFILKYTSKNSSIYNRAISLIQGLIAKANTDKMGEMAVDSYCTLVDTVKKLGLEDTFDPESLTATVKQLVYNAIERDTSKWAYYGKRPSNFITSPDSIFYKDNEEIVQKELDYLIDTRDEQGVWGITWTWFQLNEVYAREFAITENWWRAAKAIEKLRLLRSFNRLEI